MVTRFIKCRLLTGESLLLYSIIFSNGLNFIYNAYLGRNLTIEEFAIISLVNTLLYLLNMPLGAFSGSINHQIAYLMARYGSDTAHTFTRRIQQKIKLIVILSSISWLVLVPLMSWYFHIETYLPFLSFTPVVLIGLYGALARGFTIGKFLFAWTGAMYITEAVAKCVFAFVFTTSGYEEYAYLSIPLSVCLGSLVGIYGMFNNIQIQHTIEHNIHFNKKFFAASLINNVATNAFLTFDVLLVTHYLGLRDAGIYGLLALVGKMIFFFGTMLHIFVYSFVSRDEGKGINPNRNFYFILSGTIALCLIVYLGIGPFGSFFLTLLFHNKAAQIIHFTTIYGAAMVFFTIANTLAVFHLARKHYSFTFLSLIGTASILLGIVLFHNSIEQVVWSILTLSIAYLLVCILFHLLLRNGGFLVANFLDFVSLVRPLPIPEKKRNALRILVLNWRDTKHTFAGGAEIYIHECAKRWVKAGHSVTLFCGNDGKNLRSESIDGIQIVRRGGFYMVYFWAFLYYALRFKGKYDIILDCENGIPFFTPAYAKEKIFLLIHHVHQDVFRKTLWWPFAWLASTLELKVLPSLYRTIPFITVSPSTKDDIRKHTLTEVDPHIVYGGVDTSTYLPGTKDKSPTVAYIGRLKGYKSVHILIHAFAEVLKSVPDAKLIIAGDGEEKNKLEKIAEKIRITPAVTFTGRLNEEEKIALYQSAWVCVQPSFFEGWGITAIEANACGTPVIASRVEGLKDSVQDKKTGLLVPYGDIKAFSVAITQLLIDTELREKLSKQAIKWAKQFDWDTSAEKALKIMKGEL